MSSPMQSPCGTFNHCKQPIELLLGRLSTKSPTTIDEADLNFPHLGLVQTSYPSSMRIFNEVIDRLVDDTCELVGQGLASIKSQAKGLLYLLA
jgi:hypothetical protein